MAAGGRLTDWISLGVLASSAPRDAVDEAIAMAGRGVRRSDGKLPPHVAVYFAMALALFAEECFVVGRQGSSKRLDVAFDGGQIVVDGGLQDRVGRIEVPVG